MAPNKTRRTTGDRETTNRRQGRRSQPSGFHPWSQHRRQGRSQRQPFSRSPLPAFIFMSRQARFARERHFTMCASVLPFVHLLSCETFVPEVGSPSHSFGPRSPWSFFNRTDVLLHWEAVATLFASKAPSVRGSSDLLSAHPCRFLPSCLLFFVFSLSLAAMGSAMFATSTCPRALFPVILLLTGAGGFSASRLAPHVVSCLGIDSLFILIPQTLHTSLRVRMLYFLRVPLHFFT